MNRMDPGKKKLIVIFTAAAVTAIIVTVIICLAVRSLNDEAERQYAALIKEGGEASLKQAIELDPEKTEAYMDLADIYIGNGSYEEAEDILRAGSEETGDPEVDRKLENVSAYAGYYEYLDGEIIGNGLADSGDVQYSMIPSPGILSSYIIDTDNSGTPEMLVVLADEEDSLNMVYILYGMEDEAVWLDQIETGSCRDGLANGYSGEEISCYLKETDNGVYLVEQKNGAYSGGSVMEDTMKVYRLSGDGFKETADLSACYDHGIISWSDGKGIGDSADTFLFTDTAEYEEFWKNAERSLRGEVKSSGLDGRIRVENVEGSMAGPCFITFAAGAGGDVIKLADRVREMSGDVMLTNTDHTGTLDRMEELR